ncbi:thiol peroxidase [Acetoanaerobium sticklandii]|uniref:thiol peroxidase n=1 Tax=Acetoanaerobium TaxID=186831 RepID=UPI003242066B
MNKRQNIVTMKGNSITLLGNEIKVGDNAPDFTVVDNDLNPFVFSSEPASVKIISVVPSLDTSVCEFQTTHFNETASELGDVKIITISVDLPFAQKRFCVGKGIDKVKVYSDYKDLSFGLNYGFVMEELRLLARGIVVIDKNNKVTYVEYVKEATDHPNYDKAIEEARKLI